MTRRRCRPPLRSLLALTALLLASAEPQRCDNKLNDGAPKADGSKCTRMYSPDMTFQRAVCASLNLQDVPTMRTPHEVRWFRLENNCIRNLHDNSFSAFINTVFINLERNIIEHISDGAFKPVKSLDRLDISKNYLRIRNNNFLQPLNKLRELKLGNIQIILEDGFFRAQKETLEILDFDGTTELTVKEGAFSGLHKLKTLNLRNCNLKTLENTGLMVKDFEVMPLDFLNLGENPWECDCRLRWLPEWYKKKQGENGKTKFPDNPTCSGPEANREINYNGLKGIKIFEMATLATRFQCKPEVYASYSRTDHKSSEGDNVTLTCKFFSDPKGTAVWLFGLNTPSTKIPQQHGYLMSQTKGETNFEAQLTITNLKPKDQGVYMCTVSNERGSASLKHRVAVDTSKSAMVNKRMVIVVSIGAVIVITCTLMIGGVFFYRHRCRLRCRRRSI